MADISYAKRLEPITGSAIRELLKLTAKPGMISFAGGNPGNFALPDKQVAEIAHELLLSNGKKLLQYGPTEGYRPLIEVLVKYIKEEFGADVSEDEILPVSGSSQAMDLLCKACLNPGDTVLVESPTFIGNLQCLKIFEANLVPLESDEHGIVLEDIEQKIKQYNPKMLYTIPTFQNPTGITMNVERRKAIAEMAAEYKMIVAEDDPYHCLRYKGENLPTIKSFDKDGWVALLGSFSKVISPGLRVGFVATDKNLIRKLTICKQSADVHTPNLNQAIVTEFLKRNLLKDIVINACKVYGEQLNTMLDGLKNIKAVTKYTEPSGGLFIFAEIAKGKNVNDYFKKALEKNVAFVPGAPFYPQGGHENTFRLNFSNADIETIKKGMDILKEVFDEQGE
ncbi:MAG: PLP-dependent aminotransferase family protein [Eubacteriales bacterium]|nr:PLP-dependent aminotransferase family protein [Eubacteriales bacterium]